MISEAISPEHPFDAIVVYALSRFFRDNFDFTFYERKLRRHKVRIISITQPTSDDPLGNMQRQFISMFDQYSSEENSKNVRRSMIQNAIDGYFNGSNPPFGYLSFETDEPARGGKRRKLMLHAEEAETVRIMFRLAAEGSDGHVFGIKRIATHLNDSGRLHRGKLWRKQAIHTILTSTVYYGDYVFNRKEAKTGEIRPQEEWVITKVPEIVTKDEFESAAASLGERAPKKVNSKGILSPTLLTGIAKCAKCGKNMILASGKGGHYDYYRCSTRSYIGNSRCDGPNVPREELESAVMAALAEMVLKPERIATTLDAMNARLRAMQAPDRKRELDLQRQAALSVEQLNKWFTMIESGGMELASALTDHITALNRKRQALTAEIAKIQQRHRLPIRRFGEQQIEAFASGVREVVLTPGSPLAKNYLRALVSEVRVGAETTTFGGSNLELASAISRWRKGHRSLSAQTRIAMVRLAGIEPTTPWFVAKYSIQLSYSRVAAQYSTVAPCGRAQSSTARRVRTAWRAPRRPPRAPAAPAGARRGGARRRAGIGAVAACSSRRRALPHSWRSAKASPTAAATAASWPWVCSAISSRGSQSAPMP
jgi:site-specific DNA recombinase